jgi:hypothetical protein
MRAVPALDVEQDQTPFISMVEDIKHYSSLQTIIDSGRARLPIWV